jgi:hypothetical protein
VGGGGAHSFAMGLGRGGGTKSHDMYRNAGTV